MKEAGAAPAPSAFDPRGMSEIGNRQLRRLAIPQAVLALVPESVAREHLILPLGFDGETLTCAAANATSIALADKLRFLLAKNIRLVAASRDAILQAIALHYGEHADSEPDISLRESASAGLAGSHQHFAAAGASPEMSMSASTRSAPRMYQRALRLSREPAISHSSNIGRAAPSGAGRSGMLFYVVEEGQRVSMHRPNGTIDIIVGPKRVWRGRNIFRPMTHHVAHPGEFLIIRFCDGKQSHQPGPAEVWQDPRLHLSIGKEDALQIAAKEAVVVYSKTETGITRRIVYGPTLFVPEPGEWLHTFSWHASKGGSEGAQKVAHGLVFQKLWLMPDQMYHDVPDVRTADDAVLTIRLMIFFELIDIEKMLDSTHDPIGDFVNAATSDVVEFTGKHDFELFKHNTNKLNELTAYQQLAGRAAECGYRINKVVYRGYGAADSLQQMHNQAIEARTRLQLDRATEQQAQDLENYKLDCQLARSENRRSEQTKEVAHDLSLAEKRHQAKVQQREAEEAVVRASQHRESDWQLDLRRRQDSQQREHLQALRDLGVDLTAFLTQARADKVIELRGGPAGTHVHLDPLAPGAASSGNGAPAVGSS